jgi:hypothetical protein
MTLSLDMNDQEAKALGRALHSYIQEMNREIARTEDRDFRKGLRTELDQLEAISQRLDKTEPLRKPA